MNSQSPREIISQRLELDVAGNEQWLKDLPNEIRKLVAVSRRLEIAFLQTSAMWRDLADQESQLSFFESCFQPDVEEYLSMAAECVSFLPATNPLFHSICKFVKNDEIKNADFGKYCLTSLVAMIVFRQFTEENAKGENGTAYFQLFSNLIPKEFLSSCFETKRPILIPASTCTVAEAAAAIVRSLK